MKTIVIRVGVTSLIRKPLPLTIFDNHNLNNTHFSLHSTYAKLSNNFYAVSSCEHWVPPYSDIISPFEEFQYIVFKTYPTEVKVVCRWPPIDTRQTLRKKNGFNQTGMITAYYFCRPF